jgi:hypothetical protein
VNGSSYRLVTADDVPEREGKSMVLQLNEPHITAIVCGCSESHVQSGKNAGKGEVATPVMAAVILMGCDCIKMAAGKRFENIVYLFVKWATHMQAIDEKKNAKMVREKKN